MEVLLLQDIPGVGKKNDLIVVGDGFALNFLLPKRAALVATPVVRKRYAEFIKRRALEREKEQSEEAGVGKALEGKTVTIAKKATKNGKLYAAVDEKAIAEAVKEQLEAEVSADAVQMDEHIKNVGTNDIRLVVGGTPVTITVVVKAEEEAKKGKK